MQHVNSKRTEWLERAWDALRDEFLHDAPAIAALTVGFPSKRGRKGGSHTIGQCCYRFSSESGEKHFVSIHPALLAETPTRVLDVLLHEMIHSILGPGVGHGKAFRAKMREVGLEGKPTATIASESLTARLNSVSESIGPLPSGKLALDGPEEKKQTTRNRKYECPCGQIVRAATDTLAAKCLECEGDFQLA